MVWLQLDQTSIKEVPQSVTGKLKRLFLDGCSKMTKFPENLKDIEELKLRGTAIKEVPLSIQFLTRLEVVDMSGCSELESFPEITVPMKSLQSLDLSKTGIKEIPSSSFKHMISLRFLYLDGTPIKELPLSIKDMVCLRHLTFHGTAIKALPELPSSLTLQFVMDFTNCFKLDQKQLIEAMHLKIQVSLLTPSFFLLSF
jgi:Leucine-rich repeat (LRR) protein